ncbi:hypothetical protein N6L27_03670 [Leisingera sp. SS27]|uniref:hypothetical protein n=1 Tax=Leisingera sp. SS27 TaxID=2979462 RepID=UPI00232CAA19|nr:hypothetical protein [Leisingera sp. SS27]MDC0657089.1 hypothetical protein [Leisingera sp. SS27]
MTIDTSAEAVEARCQHLDHCSHDGKSEDAALMRALASERDEADRRAGAAERKNADEISDLRDTHDKRQQWLREAKASRGYDDNVSFDRVWGETCAAADERDAAHAAGRKEALEEAASLIAPHPDHDQSDWTEYAHDCNNLSNRIRALQHQREEG